MVRRSKRSASLGRNFGMWRGRQASQVNKGTALEIPSAAMLHAHLLYCAASTWYACSCSLAVKYDCSEGTCKTCEAMVGNGRAKICVAKVPNKDVTIKYNIRN